MKIKYINDEIFICHWFRYYLYVNGEIVKIKVYKPNK